jgi:hypothetical protein
MPFDELVLRGTAWASLFAWAAAEVLRSSRPPAPARQRRARVLFTAAGAALLAHSALAFHLRYAWSHEAALRDTARQTRAVTGLDFGGGIFVNDAFLILWAIEIAWWWSVPARYHGRPPFLDGMLRAFFLFMFFNGAVVFASGPVRAAGLVATLGVLWAWYRRAGAASGPQAGAQGRHG